MEPQIAQMTPIEQQAMTRSSHLRNLRFNVFRPWLPSQANRHTITGFTLSKEK
jgi:hypothetical protein